MPASCAATATGSPTNGSGRRLSAEDVEALPGRACPRRLELDAVLVLPRDAPQRRGDRDPATADEELAEMLEGVEQRQSSSGHTHMQQDRRDRRRCASSTPGASACRTRASSPPSGRWSDDGEIELRKTSDRGRPRRRRPFRRSGWPRAEELLRENVRIAVGRRASEASGWPGSRRAEIADELVRVGRVGKPHGLDGSFFVEHGSEDDSALRGRRDTARGRRAGEGRRLEALARPARDQARPRGRRAAPSSRSRAPSFRRPSEGEYYEFQLVGLEAEEEGGRDARQGRGGAARSSRTTCSSWTRACCSRWSRRACGRWTSERVES